MNSSEQYCRLRYWKGLREKGDEQYKPMCSYNSAYSNVSNVHITVLYFEQLDKRHFPIHLGNLNEPQCVWPGKCNAHQRVLLV